MIVWTIVESMFGKYIQDNESIVKYFMICIYALWAITFVSRNE